MDKQLSNHRARVFLFRGVLFVLLLMISLWVAPWGVARDAAPESGTSSAAVTMVYWTEVDTGKIHRGNADGSGSAQTCVTNQSNPRGLVIANSLGKMYWIERNAGRLRRANLDCTGVETIGPALSNADRLALDLVGGKIYWTENTGTNRIRRADLDGSNAETILPSLSEPVGVAVDHTNGYLYWTEFTTNQIWRSSLSGANKLKILDLAPGTNPLDIVLDVEENRMYWTSGALGAIYSATLSGSGAGIWRPLSEPRSIAIDVEGNKLYWADQGTLEIRRDNLDKSNNQLLFNADDGVDRPLGVALLTGSVTTCYNLTRTHTGQGSNPTAAPTSSSGCANGTYTGGGSITLTASPAAGWHVAGWNGTNNDAGTGPTNTVNMPNTDHTVSVTYEQDEVSCYSLSRSHTGQGNDPIASPAFSTGCGTGQYTAGQLITLAALATPGWHVAGWSGTNDDGSNSPSNTVNMPAIDHNVSVTYEQDMPNCYTLSRSHTGQGNDPIASPAFSTGCGTGQYTLGQSITLSASAAAGWRVAGWSGTNNDGSSSTSNTVNMPAIDHNVSVTYEPNPSGFVFYVPFVIYTIAGPPPCFPGPAEQEPNNDAGAANGPLCSAGTYTGLPNDDQDYFLFDTSTSGSIAVIITGHRGDGVQLQLYYGGVAGDPIDEDLNQSDGLSVSVPNGGPGHYYILIYTETPKPAENQFYTMQVTFP